VADEEARMLLEAILDYVLWLEAEEEPTARRVSELYRQILIDFAIFSMHRDIAWQVSKISHRKYLPQNLENSSTEFPSPLF
jgi:hypothetical protein